MAKENFSRNLLQWMKGASREEKTRVQPASTANASEIDGRFGLSAVVVGMS